MGMTMTEKILAKHAGIDVVKPGQLINCKLDMVLANDVTAPPAIKEFEKIGKPVFDNTKIALVLTILHQIKISNPLDLLKLFVILHINIIL